MQGESFVDALTKALVKRNVIEASEAQALRSSFEESDKARFDEFLLDEGLVDKDDLLPALAAIYQKPYFDAVGYFFDHQLVRVFPQEFLIRHAIIPIELDENMLIFVASDPSNPELLPLIGEYVSYDLHFRVGIRQDIINAIEEFHEQSPAQVNTEFDEDDDETRTMREDEIANDEALEKMDIEDIEDE